MSRIGKLPIEIPGNIDVNIKNNIVTVKGPRGELSYIVNPGFKIELEDQKIHVKRPSDDKRWRSLHGLTRTLINNMLVGVSEGYSKGLLIEGVGYKAESRGKFLILTLGYSHPIYFLAPEGVSIQVPAPNRVEISGIDKVLVGEVTAKIRSFRPPEPYKGKGIRYLDEHIRRKAGKTAG